METFGQNPSDRLNPSFSPDMEDEVQELDPVIMGPPAYSSPDPKTAQGYLAPVEEHPLSADLSDDYGAAEKDLGHDAEYRSSMAAGREGEADFTDFPEDRKDWSRTHWQKAAKQFGIPHSGTKTDVQSRVEAYEAEREADKDMKAADWTDEIDDAEDAESLALIAERYQQSGADLSSVQDALDKKSAELAEEAAGDDDEQ